jgi:hypothetical protein
MVALQIKSSKYWAIMGLNGNFPLKAAMQE